MNNFEILLFVNDLKKCELYDDFMRVIHAICDPIIEENDTLKAQAELHAEEVSRLTSIMAGKERELTRLRKLEEVR